MSGNDPVAENGSSYSRPSVAIVALIFLVLTAAAGQQVRLIPKFAAGETFRYRVETSTSTSSKTTGPISNPGGATQSSQSISLLVRLDVLHTGVAGPGTSPGSVRLRATYEKSQSISHANAYDPAAPSLDDPYNRLEGQAIEFTLESDGTITDFKASGDISPNRSEAAPFLSWAKSLSSGAGAPQQGIAIGQKWGSEHPLSGMPLSDLIWRSDSTYLRNETCGSFAAENSSSAANPAKPKSSGTTESCAVILTRFRVSRRGSPHSDATPPDYARNGLRTSGTWEGSGESLDSISLASGLLVRSTQTSTQDGDYEITSASSGSSIHQVSHVTTQTEITLMPESQSIAQPQ